MNTIAQFSIRPYLAAVAKNEGTTVEGLPQTMAEQLKGEFIRLDDLGAAELRKSQELLRSLVRTQPGELEALEGQLSANGVPAELARYAGTAALCGALASDPVIGPATAHFICFATGGEGILKDGQLHLPSGERFEQAFDNSSKLPQASDAELAADQEVQAAGKFHSVLKWAPSDIAQTFHRLGTSEPMAHVLEAQLKQEMITTEPALRPALQDLRRQNGWPLATPETTGLIS